MAQFRGTIQGQRGDVSRLGSVKSGLSATANGWNVGARVTIKHEDGKDVVRVYMTRGSSYRGGARLLAEFSEFTEGEKPTS